MVRCDGNDIDFTHLIGLVKAKSDEADSSFLQCKPDVLRIALNQ
jgi:hypothetical protein